MSNRPMTFARPASVQRIERILSTLSDRAMTQAELAAAVHVSHAQCRSYLVYLRKTQQIYVADWIRHVETSSRMYPRPLYRAGNLPDAARPPALTKEELNKRSWDLVRLNRERHEAVNKRRRARSIKPKANPLTFWIKPT